MARAVHALPRYCATFELPLTRYCLSLLARPRRLSCSSPLWTTSATISMSASSRARQRARTHHRLLGHLVLWPRRGQSARLDYLGQPFLRVRALRSSAHRVPSSRSVLTRAAFPGASCSHACVAWPAVPARARAAILRSSLPPARAVFSRSPRSQARRVPTRASRGQLFLRVRALLSSAHRVSQLAPHSHARRVPRRVVFPRVRRVPTRAAFPVRRVSARHQRCGEYALASRRDTTADAGELRCGTPEKNMPCVCTLPTHKTAPSK
jgi:hypothetical protein